MKKIIVLALILLLAVGSASSSVLAQDEEVTLRLASWQWEDPAYLPYWEGTTEAFHGSQSERDD